MGEPNSGGATGPTFTSGGAAKGYVDEARRQIILSNNRLVSEQRCHRLLYFLRRVAAPFLLLQNKDKKENCQNQVRGSVAREVKARIRQVWQAIYEKLMTENRKFDLFAHKRKSLIQSDRLTDSWRQTGSAVVAELCCRSLSLPAGGALFFTFLHANMQLTSIGQAKSFFGSTYNLLSSSTLLRSLVTWRRNQTR